jgi:(p)ppGpp synthase/HD superfamily hydrolase
MGKRSPAMRTFAMTYPQLVMQAMAARLDELSLRRLRDAYDVVASVTEGVYGPAGTPAVCRIVRTASIVLAEGQPLEVVLAALLQADDGGSVVTGPRRWLARRAQRRFLAALAGSSVDALVFEYRQLPWHSRVAVADHLEHLASYASSTRQALVMRLASELDAHLDGTALFADRHLDAGRRDARGGYVTLARRLHRHALADDLEEAFELEASLVLPRSVTSSGDDVAERGPQGRPGARRAADVITRRLRKPRR